MKNKISVAIATLNEEANIQRSLDSVTSWVDEIIIVDEGSTDKTLLIAKKYSNVKIIITTHEPNFHITKQKAIDACHNDWILLLDADEQVSPDLSTEIVKVSQMDDKELDNYQELVLKNPIFSRHQKLIETRDGTNSKKSSVYTAFYIPRLNYFLGSYLIYGGVYPDGVIRFFNKSHSHQPAKDVHEQIVTDGQIGWLGSNLYHFGDPKFSNYLKRHDRYATLFAQKLFEKNVPLNFNLFVNYFLIKPIYWFMLTYFRHKGFKDGFPGFVFSYYSALRFPTTFVKYWELFHAKKI
jgi:glycosyltransferase involved in cell wall biosynthesis